MNYFKDIDGLRAWEGFMTTVKGEGAVQFPLRALSRYALVWQYLSSFYGVNEQ
jgi:hypothetical protein